MKKILVTGGLGYIGSHTTVELLTKGYEVIIVDNLSKSDISILNNIKQITCKQPFFEKIDCCNYDDLKNVFESYDNIIGIIHFAAYKCVGESVNNPLMYYHNNILPIINILKLMKEYKINNLIFSSSCTVYGQPDVLPITEETSLPKANCPYGNSKQINEEIIIDTINSDNNINSIILRYFNPIGAHPSGLLGELPIDTPQNLLPYISQTAIGKREILNIFGNTYNTPDGTCIRDYIDIIDLANAHIIALERLLNNENNKPIEIFNLGLGKPVTVLEMVKLFESVNNIKLNYQFVDKRAGDVEKIYSDITKAKEILKWEPLTKLEDTLKNVWKWEKYINNKL